MIHPTEETILYYVDLAILIRKKEKKKHMFGIVTI